ncbi:MAG: WYL domain-containing protein, partial [Bacteroidetes bacterium]|nr:WYL domain-containing protein [Bacteroidota bacterium]
RIISPNESEPEEIVLSFEPNQGKYIKSLPLHNTQQILIDNDKELQVRLQLYITFDFVMELLSFADNMKVIKPKSLIKEIKDAHGRAFKQYKS